MLKRPPNRIVLLCSAINDETPWPFWKFRQLQRLRGVTDVAMLAFTSDGGAFEARLDGTGEAIRNHERVRGYDAGLLRRFLRRWHAPGRTYFVYGGHGMGDYLELEKEAVALQTHELAAAMHGLRYEAMLFDACFMANLDCAAQLAGNTRYIGACEGYMWEDDAALDRHVLNSTAASAMCRFASPLKILEAAQRCYCARSPLADFSIIETTHAAALKRFVDAHVMPRVYARARFYGKDERSALSDLAAASLAANIPPLPPPTAGDSNSGGGGEDTGEEGDEAAAVLAPREYPKEQSDTLLTHKPRWGARQQRLWEGVQFEHALYPSLALDKHLVDLRAYLLDMAAAEAAAAAAAAAAATGAGSSATTAPSGNAAAVAVAVAAAAAAPPRTESPATQGELPPLVERPLVDVTAAGGVPPLTPGSAGEGLALFDCVVLRHVAPQRPGVYASRLGGLSLAVRDFSDMSVAPRDAAPEVYDRAAFKRRADAFLRAERRRKRDAASKPPSPVIDASEKKIV